MENNGTLKDKVYDLVLESILTNEFRPQQILTEKQLIERYGYSRSPVREGLLTLCQNHILRNIPRCGYEVQDITREDSEHIMLVRYLLECGVIPYTYDKFTAAQIEELERLNAECLKAKDDVYMHWDYNVNFHLALLAPTGNHYEKEILEYTMRRLKRVFFQFYRTRAGDFDLSDDIQCHNGIIDAIRRKDKESLLFQLRSDIQYFAGQRFENLDQLPKI